MRAIIIGTSLSGKTTLIKELRKVVDIPISEIDEELTSLNDGNYPADATYKNSILIPKIAKELLTKK